jgi:hypothetical protein
MSQLLSAGSFLSASGERRRHWPWLTLRLVLVIGSLVILFGGTLRQHIERSADPFTFNDDVRQQIYPFYKYEDPQLFPDDLPARYYLDNFPLGYRLLYTALVPAFGTAGVSKGLPYVLFAILLLMAGLAASRLGGWLPAWFTLAFCLSGSYFLARIAGGLPRSFAFPLLACAIAALASGRMYALALCTVLGAALYAPVAVVCGLTLACVLLGLPARDRGDAARWGLKQRLVVLGLTALVAALLLVPVSLNGQQYGRILRPADVGDYPEAGEGGRYGAEDRAPFYSLPEAMLKMLPTTFASSGAPWAPDLRTRLTQSVGPWQVPWVLLGMAAIIGGGFVLKAATSAEARRIGAFLLAACVAYVIAQRIAPYFYLPQRYTGYPMPLLGVILFPVAVQALMVVFGRFGQNVWVGSVAVVLVCGLALYALGGRGAAQAGLHPFADKHAKIYRFIETLPKEARVAAWPNGIANNIPYLSRREVLIHEEIHQAFHQAYVEEMRRRMRALIDAYYATDPASLVKLRDDFGVDYLLVDEDHFFTKPPTYFKPFNAWAHEARQKAPDDLSELEVFRQMDHATVFREGSLVVLDLHRVDPVGLSHRP